MDAENLDVMVWDYEFAHEKNKESDKYSYLYTANADFRRYSRMQAEMVDLLTIPFDVSVSDRAYETILEMWDSRENKLKTLFKGHDKEYYENLRNEANEKIAQEQDKLEKAILIEKYGAQLLEASEFFKTLEAFERLKSGKVWGNW